MLMAEGFVTAQDLASKFTTLYALCKDLLSKARHFTIGVSEPSSPCLWLPVPLIQHGEPDVTEEDLLMRALRDFNLPKI